LGQESGERRHPTRLPFVSFIRKERIAMPNRRHVVVPGLLHHITYKKHMNDLASEACTKAGGRVGRPLWQSLAIAHHYIDRISFCLQYPSGSSSLFVWIFYIALAAQK
jgi:hypothetical protein